ncbi:somatoliberin [Microcaecilia unicolor]|uniref:Somatoliberin n=1 Tax=Microcaecilia unicolor TaxID=1415580 RepID=A0A6P7YXX2_9AMPH|nr:somatoliberin [Microcaecilia unicolor]
MLASVICLVFLHLMLCSSGFPLYSEFRYNQLPISGKEVNFQLLERDPLQSPDLSLDEQAGFLTDTAQKRTERHADAIFTNSYRKFLGHISARKFLQTIMGKRLGESNHEKERQGFLSRRQSDSILMDSHYYKQMAIKNVLGAILYNLSNQDLNGEAQEDHSYLAELLKV